MFRSQKGFTVIELLVTIVIVSFIGIIIWNVLFQGYRFSQNSMSKTAIQQEANVTITTLKRIHQTSIKYTIDSTNCVVTVAATKLNSDGSTSIKNYEFNDSDLCYSIDNTGTVVPDDTDLSIKLTVNERKNPNNLIEISAILYRLKDGGISGQ